jgi:hypothetical protein
MTGTRCKWVVFGLCTALAGLFLTGLPLSAGPNERVVNPGGNVQDADAERNGKLWVLHFKFKDPRLIKVHIPGRGQKVCWYLWYQVINRTGEPRTFIPDFELVTHDTNMVYRDQILPAVQDAIARIEDPTGHYKIKNSVTISRDPIPLSLEKAIPRPVTAVAIWTDPNEPNPTDDEATRKRKAKMPKLADSNRYSIFVAGLSNGWAVTDDPEKPGVKSIVRRKTLQLNFRRLGDRYFMRSEEIRFMPPAQWIYRGSPLTVPGLSTKEAGKEKAPAVK